MDQHTAQQCTATGQPKTGKPNGRQHVAGGGGGWGAPVGAAVQQDALQGCDGGLQEGPCQVGGQGLAGSRHHVLQSAVQLHQHWMQAGTLHMVLVQLLQHWPPQVKEDSL